ncbi:hypothetical protein PR048_003382 [Dryococelus australis]|uniref:Uncharacterized protein n=1 Tax=Dryococelus australis TaxID=614101 RepID=A0ABQ9IMZ0_9NEOP|nr:hypothetical protein PR048_003382 [Dryococelus australis]
MREVSLYSLHKIDHYATATDLAMVHHIEQCPFCTGSHVNCPPTDKDETPLPTSESDLLEINHNLAIRASSFNIGLVKRSYYKACLGWLNSSFLCRFSILDQTTIVSSIPIANLSVVVQEDILKPGIDISDVILGPLIVVLSTGAVGADTLFGWTLMGTEKKSPVVCCITNLDTTLLMATVTDGDVAVIQLRRTGALRHLLPWNTSKELANYLYDLVFDLPTNYELAKRQLIKVTNKMCHTAGLFEDYDSVIQECLRLNIIEESEEDIMVVKETNGTTKVSPVFYALAKIGRYPSLNDCLEQGQNLI